MQTKNNKIMHLKQLIREEIKRNFNNNINEGYTVNADNPYQFVNGAKAVLSAYLRDEDLGPNEKKKLTDIITNLDYLAKYFISKK